jgi:glycolate oxidase iron-sulfur subunit
VTVGDPESAFASFLPLRPLMQACVHCGFCLPTCPSYLLTGQEMDSPRGRIYLLAAGSAGRLDMNDSVVAHFDTCLGCMACETACPSGVRYAPLIESARNAIETHHTRPLGQSLLRRLLFLLLPFPRRLRIAAVPLVVVTALRRRLESIGLLSRLPPRISALLTLAPSMTRARLFAETPECTPATSAQRMRVGLLTGCAQRVFFGHINQATARVLAAEGCEVIAPQRQGCCGALALHGGHREDARDCARQLMATFEATGLDRIVVSTAGCGSAMKEYGALLADDPTWAARAREFAAQVRDVTEVLTELGPAQAPRHPIPIRVAYHDACHLAHAQGIRTQPRDLLGAIPELTLVSLAENEVCCGSAGIFNLVQPEMGAELGRRKAARITESGADVVATSNAGCMLQIGASGRATGNGRPILHVVELLDASIRNTVLHLDVD